MPDTPRPTEEEQEQGPERLQEEEDMRGPGDADPQLPGSDPGNGNDDA